MINPSFPFSVFDNREVFYQTVCSLQDVINLDNFVSSFNISIFSDYLDPRGKDFMNKGPTIFRPFGSFFEIGLLVFLNILGVTDPYGDRDRAEFLFENLNREKMTKNCKK